MQEITRRGVCNAGIHNTGKTREITRRSVLRERASVVGKFPLALSTFFLSFKSTISIAFPLESFPPNPLIQTCHLHSFPMKLNPSLFLRFSFIPNGALVYATAPCVLASTLYPVSSSLSLLTRWCLNPDPKI